MQFESKMARGTRRAAATAALGAIVLAGASSALATNFGEWSEPANAENLSGSKGSPNSSDNDGCPILDPYTNDLYIASTRPGGFGGLDIWIATWNGSGWNEPVNAGSEINSVTNDYCPTPARGNRLFFVSRKDDPNGDIYVAKRSPKGGYRSVERLPDGINSPAEEWSPSVFDDDDGNEVLYFSSTRDGGQDIYESVSYGEPTKVASLSTEYSDARPNVSRNGREIVFDTDRPGGKGASDIWTAARGSTSSGWGTPVPITQINSAAGESRASISWDGTAIVFGSGRPGGEGGSDIYVATRERAPSRKGPKTIEF